MNLSSKIKTWWDNNPQGYGKDLKSIFDKSGSSDDSEFLNYLNENDKNFINAAYFAQNSFNDPFSKLFPKDLSNKVVLEIGCGLGFHTELLSGKCRKVISIDLSEYAVEVTKKRLLLKGINNVDVYLASATSIPLENECVDDIWSWGVIHHIPDSKLVVNEIYRVLKKKGSFYGMFYNKNSLYNWLNVYLRYGIFKLEIFKLSNIQLSSKYSDGKDFGGNPYTIFYSTNELKKLFKDFSLKYTHSFENKNIFLFFLPYKLKIRLVRFIPNNLMFFLFKNFGFLKYVNFIKK